MLNRLFIFLLVLSLLSITQLQSQSIIQRNCKSKLQAFNFLSKKPFTYFSENKLYLLGGMNASKQNITTGDYNSSFNYVLSDYNMNTFKPGYFAGIRIDGKYKHVHDYSLLISLNKINPGLNYKENIDLSPFLGGFTKFKADDQFFTLSLALHYKKLIDLGDTSKRKFYIVMGPSFDTRLSDQSVDNLVKKNYHQLLLRGDLGFEFDNHSYYTLFFHYKQGLSSFTKSPIKTNLNTVEVGMMLRASDLF